MKMECKNQISYLNEININKKHDTLY